MVAARWDFFQLTAQTCYQAMQARNERFKYNPSSTWTVENVLFCNAKQGTTRQAFRHSNEPFSKQGRMFRNDENDVN
eukprot:CAMPEP_0202482024 /NCGR_PEP_ID=MMETSP1361-20130828/1483_1 /ASSEMBLY_ACC=CAM_ASM_000849 /TAXON_ID=210615 /ORGANISM="Staurosira complex sp., Strain CCMP2646" /LENGTH=76 /DNA_ID=CAMNT_0049109731 /DNA_START=724 /DNA_END=954 /DNA_ORIENTATION=+